MRYEPDTTADQRARDRMQRRERDHQAPAPRDRKSFDRETIRHHHEEIKLIARRTP